jgi:hypothetical protein
MGKEEIQSLLGEEFMQRFLDRLAHADEYTILAEDIDPTKASPEFLAELERLKATRLPEEEM